MLAKTERAAEAGFSGRPIAPCGSSAISFDSFAIAGKVSKMAAVDDMERRELGCSESGSEQSGVDLSCEATDERSLSPVPAKRKRSEDEDSVLAASIGVGLCVGVAWGIAIDKLALGIALGLCMGVAFGSFAGFWKKR